MPETAVAGQDTVQMDAPNGAESVVVSPSNEDTEATSLIFGKYKTIEEAEKAHKESERRMHEAAQEAARVKDRIRELEERSQLTEVVKSLAESQKPKQPVIDWKEVQEKIKEKFREDPGAGVEEVFAVTNSWITQEVRQAEQKTKLLESELNELKEAVEKSDVFYQQNQELVDGLVKDGMSLKKAKTWAKKMVQSQKAEMPEGQIPPASMAGSRVVQRSVTEPLIAKDERARMVAEYMGGAFGRPLSQADAEQAVARIEAKMAQRAAKAGAK